MKTTCLKVGLHLTLNNIQYQIAKILLPNMVHLERIVDGGLISISKLELILALSSGDLVLDGGKQSSVIRVEKNLDCLKEIDRTIVLRRLAFVREAIRKLGNTPTTVGLSLISTQVSQKLGLESQPSSQTVYRWWLKFSRSGQDVMSLVDREPGKKGNRAFSSIVLSKISEVINSVYLTRQKHTVKIAYDTLKYEMDRLNDTRLEPLRYPSKAQFYRIVGSRNKYDVAVQREGKRFADACFRMVGAGPIVNYILERVEVDHSPLDVLVLDESKTIVIGRPNLTVVIDCYSRMYLGWYIGFEPPSQLSVMRAIQHSILPKGPNQNPTYGIPNVLVCDNGLEFHSDLLKRLCAELSIDLLYCPRQEPNYKGKIERGAGLINKEIGHKLNGTTFSNVRSRGDYDSEKLARVTLSELKDLIFDWERNDYSQRIHRGTNRVPEKLWEEGLQIIEPNLPESAQKLQFALTQETERTLTHKGIEIFNLFYNSAALRTIRTRSTENQRVLVRYDIEDLGAIWVFDSKSNDYLKVHSTEPEYADGLTKVQHRYIRSELIKKGQSEQNEKAVLAHRIRLMNKIDTLNKSKKMRDRQKSARLSQHLTEPKNSINAITAPADKPQPSEPFTIDNTLSFDIKSLGGSS